MPPDTNYLKEQETMSTKIETLSLTLSMMALFAAAAPSGAVATS